MGTTTVRVSEETRDKLRALSQATNQPMAAVLDQALDAYGRERFFRELDAAYDALWSDPQAREEELTERRLWEGTLGDGLNDE